jgi:hypothetical protein
MTATTWNPKTLTTLTLPEGKWGTIKTAVLCLAVDEHLQGNREESARLMEAFNALKEAMGE